MAVKIMRTGSSNFTIQSPADTANADQATQSSSRAQPAPTPSGSGTSGVPRSAGQSASSVANKLRAGLDPLMAMVAAEPAVHLMAFKGTVPPKALEKPDGPHPYQVTGHVGYSFNNGETIFGFGPSLPPGMKPLDAIKSLSKKQIYSGKISDDTAVFHEVANNQRHKHGVYDQQVISKRIPMSAQDLEYAKAAHAQYGLGQPTAISYGFPNDRGDSANCATFPAKLGIPIPERTGVMAKYMPEMMKDGSVWKPG